VERKVIPTYTKGIEGREVTGIFAVHGVVDYVMDRSWPGSFSKTIREGMSTKNIKYLWSHNMDWGASGPPTAAVVDLKEVPREELPPELLAAYPEASGGVQVARKYLQTPRGEEAYQGLLEGAITQQSYGYDPVKTDFTPIATETGNSQVRELKEVKLWEVSDVLWGANPATIASKAHQLEVLWTPETGIALEHIKAIIEGLGRLSLKSGARHSGADRKLIKSIHNMIVDLEPTVCKGKPEDTEEDKEDPEEDPEEDPGKKSITQPPAGQKDTAGALPPLWTLKQQLELLELEMERSLT
jgi:hypothetical protein